ncbi:hypothetical protein PCL1606_58200 [Pseudomonas chlororaphis]|uniref:Uncharacterized protein n=1 Tax=Pseudomonas chlororaphis TaxID=587753 RepID=A0A0D5Y7I7_9PSED|nr:hypothetical protein PCL1606_58200 [Pseudomonas chlororaphis]
MAGTLAHDRTPCTRGQTACPPERRHFTVCVPGEIKNYLCWRKNFFA